MIELRQMDRRDVMTCIDFTEEEREKYEKFCVYFPEFSDKLLDDLPGIKEERDERSWNR